MNDVTRKVLMYAFQQVLPAGFTNPGLELDVNGENRLRFLRFLRVRFNTYVVFSCFFKAKNGLFAATCFILARLPIDILRCSRFKSNNLSSGRFHSSRS